MAPFAQQGGSISDSGRSDLVSTVTPAGTSTSNSYSTKGSTPTPVSSITTMPSMFSTSTATPTYISKGSPTSTDTSLRGSQPPSKMTIQSSTLAFVLILTLLLGMSLGILAWKKGRSRSHRNSNTTIIPLQPPKPPMLRRQDSNATLVDESSLRRHRRERTVTIETSELHLQGDGSVRHVESNVIQVPQKTFGGLAAS